MKAYREGFAAGFSPEYPECPYVDGSPEHEEWYDGFGAALDALDEERRQ